MMTSGTGSATADVTGAVECHMTGGAGGVGAAVGGVAVKLPQQVAYENTLKKGKISKEKIMKLGRVRRRRMKVQK